MCSWILQQNQLGVSNGCSLELNDFILAQERPQKKINETQKTHTLYLNSCKLADCVNSLWVSKIDEQRDKIHIHTPKSNQAVEKKTRQITEKILLLEQLYTARFIA